MVLEPTDISAPAALVVGIGLALASFIAAAVLYLLVERPVMDARSRYVAG